MTKTRNTILALLAVGLVALSALAVPAIAKPGDESGDGHRGPKADERREAAQERRDAAKHQAELRGNHTREHCLAAAGNDTVNETEEKRCMRHGEFAEKAFKARRAAHALLGAINATERQWARLNATEAMLEAKLAAGNFTGNETAASIEKRLERIDAKQERVEERLEKLQERLGKLHAKWDAVREHVAEKRRMHDGDGDDESSSSSSSSASQSASASPSGSASESSSESASESSSSSSPPA